MQILVFIILFQSLAIQGKTLYFFKLQTKVLGSDASVNDFSQHDIQRINDYLNFFSQMVSD